jgi:hypothetical protein
MGMHTPMSKSLDIKIIGFQILGEMLLEGCAGMPRSVRLEKN